ncbi:MAG: glycosyltransferase family 9 protein [Burkholderiaceae bacterium]|nr:glycosyltransferase family 9 protein [Burkholderiaceae bacterium]MCD8538154.1 glycosyltransferase family 9 protein [Burkholderiaceae bacterium]MCD8565812.1 glycosyltransferase family 9 protein [Burkholderiaceae bacterium]
MSLPALAAIHDSVKLAERSLIICGRPWAKDLVAEFDPQQFVELTGKFWGDRRAVLTIPSKSRHNSLGLIMPDSFSSAALFASTQITSAGYRDDGRSWLLRWPIKKPVAPVHAAQKWWLLTQTALRQWGLHCPALENDLPPYTSLKLNDSDRNKARALLAVNGLESKAFVLVAPTATGTHHGKVKVWPHFGELVQALRISHTDIEIVMCPPAHEQDQARQACPQAKLLPPLPLKAFCALAQMARLVICNDSGVSHLAAAVNAEQLTLFGVTNPAHTRPWTTRAHLIGQENQWPDAAAVLAKVKEILALRQPHTTNSF